MYMWISYLQYVMYTFLCVENEDTHWLALLRLLNNCFFFLFSYSCFEDWENSYEVCTQSHPEYVHPSHTLNTEKMCEECKSSQWSKNWPYLWLMAWLISPGIFSNMPRYWLLYSAFVIIKLSTLEED